MSSARQSLALPLTTDINTHTNKTINNNNTTHIHTHTSQLNLAIHLWLCAMSTSKSWDVNRHTVWCNSPVSVVLQCKLESGWGLISAVLWTLGLRKNLTFYVHAQKHEPQQTNRILTKTNYLALLSHLASRWMRSIQQFLGLQVAETSEGDKSRDTNKLWESRRYLEAQDNFLLWHRRNEDLVHHSTMLRTGLWLCGLTMTYLWTCNQQLQQLLRQKLIQPLLHNAWVHVSSRSRIITSIDTFS